MLTRNELCGKEKGEIRNRSLDRFNDVEWCVALRRRVEGTFFVEAKSRRADKRNLRLSQKSSGDTLCCILIPGFLQIKTVLVRRLSSVDVSYSCMD